MNQPPHICHLTVLNPLQHSRIYHRLARSQRRLGYRVSILARGESAEVEGIQLVGLRPFGRLSWRRFLFPLRIFSLARQQRADLYVLHSPELLLTGLLLKWAIGARIWYDVHEDYRVNIRGAQHYPGWLRKPLAGLVRAWERLAMKWVDAVSYAEDCYDDVLGVGKERRIMLRNKFAFSSKEKERQFPTPKQPYLLYTGTIAVDWGLWESLALWQQLNQVRPLDFVLAGHTHRAALIAEVMQWVSKADLLPRFHLIGGLAYVPYPEMLHLIRHCWAGVGLYRPLPHIRGKVPTKFYEFMAHDRPLIFTDLPEWQAFDQQYQLGIAWPGEMNPAALMEAVDQWQSSHPVASFAWEGEVPAMQQLLGKVLGKA